MANGLTVAQLIVELQKMPPDAIARAVTYHYQDDGLSYEIGFDIGSVSMDHFETPYTVLLRCTEYPK